MAKNYYQILGVKASATQEEIKKAYRSKAKRSHPDVNPSPAAAAEFVRINEAYEILSDPGKRSVYDDKLRIARARAHRQNSTANSIEDYEHWVRHARQRARQHAKMSFDDFRKSRFYRAEVQVFLYLQFLIMGFIFLAGLFVLSIPFIGMFLVSWKTVFLCVVLTPVSLKIFKEGKKGLKELREAL